MRGRWRRSLLLLLMTACGGGGAATTEPAVSNQPVLGAIELAPSAVSLELGDTIRLEWTARDTAGGPLGAASTPSFQSSDSEIASVDASGLVTGLSPGQATITATLTMTGITRSGSSSVGVEAPELPPPLPAEVSVSTPDRSFVPDQVTLAVNGTVTWVIVDRRHNITFIGPAPPGGSPGDVEEGTQVARTFPQPGTYEYYCARHVDRGMRGSVVVEAQETGDFAELRLTPGQVSLGVGEATRLTATPVDVRGVPISGLPTAAFESSDPSVAPVDDDGVVSGAAAGEATITATLTSEGITRTANAAVTVKQEGTAVTVTTPDLRFEPPTVSIPRGGTVQWQISQTTHNVIFRGAAPPGGDIPDTQAGITVSRSFPEAGRYEYDCTRHNGMSGTVIVD